MLFSEANSINSNAFRYTPPKMNDHPTLLTLENTSTQKSHQPITSILKKPSNQKYKDLSSTKNDCKSIKCFYNLCKINWCCFSKS